MKDEKEEVSTHMSGFGCFWLLLGLAILLSFDKVLTVLVLLFGKCG